jgi:hypothetical protein
MSYRYKKMADKEWKSISKEARSGLGLTKKEFNTEFAKELKGIRSKRIK